VEEQDRLVAAGEPATNGDKRLGKPITSRTCPIIMVPDIGGLPCDGCITQGIRALIQGTQHVVKRNSQGGEGLDGGLGLLKKAPQMAIVGSSSSELGLDKLAITKDEHTAQARMEVELELEEGAKASL
jgi:hypothetical protein